jgi:hypothetical protein
MGDIHPHQLEVFGKHFLVLKINFKWNLKRHLEEELSIKKVPKTHQRVISTSGGNPVANPSESPARQTRKKLTAHSL